MKTLTLILACLLLSACGDNAADDSARQEDEETVFDPLIESVDEAKAVEDTVMQQKHAMDEAVKQMEEGTDDPDEEGN